MKRGSLFLSILILVSFSFFLVPQKQKGSTLFALSEKGDATPAVSPPGTSIHPDTEKGKPGFELRWCLPDRWAPGLAIGDVDGDGKVEIVCGEPEKITILHQDASGEYKEIKQIADGGAGKKEFGSIAGWFLLGRFGQMPTVQFAPGIALGDVDDDEDLDLICGVNYYRKQHIDKVSLYINDGTGNFQYKRDIVDKGPGVSLGDIDGDAMPDLVVNTWDGIHNGYFKNRNGEFSWIPDKIDTEPFKRPPGPGIATGDVNNDGKADLILASPWGQLNVSYYENTDGIFKFKQRIIMSQGYTGLCLADFDSDGDRDLLVSSGADTGYYENVNFTFMNRGIIHKKAYGPGIAVVDLDKDGDLDVFTGTAGTDIVRSTSGEPGLRFFENTSSRK